MYTSVIGELLVQTYLVNGIGAYEASPQIFAPQLPKFGKKVH